MFKRILVATDGSALSRKAVKSAIALAAQNDADLVALTVVPRYPKSFFEGSMSFSAEDIGRIEKQWADKAQATLDAVRDRALAQGVRIRTAQASSDLVAESIIAAAKKNRSDLIVMASHGRGGLSAIVLGSVTNKVLTHTKTPVLVYR